jgi:hypothetical protein
MRQFGEPFGRIAFKNDARLPAPLGDVAGECRVCCSLQGISEPAKSTNAALALMISLTSITHARSSRPILVAATQADKLPR